LKKRKKKAQSKARPEGEDALLLRAEIYEAVEKKAASLTTFGGFFAKKGEGKESYARGQEKEKNPKGFPSAAEGKSQKEEEG